MIATVYAILTNQKARKKRSIKVQLAKSASRELTPWL